MEAKVVQRFEKYIMPEPMSGCWLWAGTVDQNGYGQFKYIDRNEKAHRISYKIYVGEIPEGLIICHHCDNPPCVNPHHLFAGTRKDNTQDMIRKGRKCLNLGESHPLCKLTDVQVLEIRELYSTGKYTQMELGKRFNVAFQNISQIVRSETRKSA